MNDIYSGITATYSPEDNKIRLSSVSRLPKELYERVRAAGFIWAPKQEVFVAPMWTPEREDLAYELAGTIDDEDTSLVDRAEQRAERFEDYSDSRAQDANRARSAVSAIADGIPLGQPILVGHHSERHARRDAEKIENGMRRAVRMWETSQYWKQRAAGAIRHAKYKELPAVRARRIKGLEAEKRKQERDIQTAEMWLKLWTECEKEPDKELQKSVALRIANMCWLHLPRKAGDREDFNQNPTAYDALTESHPTLYAPRTLEEVFSAAQSTYPRGIAHSVRWLNHINNRLEYERAMLEETGGLKADGFDLQVGGRILRRGSWLVITKLNKRDGILNSVSVAGHFASVVALEDIREYQPPTAEETAFVQAKTKLPPLCNYPGEGFLHVTKAECEKLTPKWSDFPKMARIEAGRAFGAHRVRQVRKPGGQYFDHQCVFITDAKRTDPPAADAPKPVKPESMNVAPQRALWELSV
jgi:hypothetical protein